MFSLTLNTDYCDIKGFYTFFFNVIIRKPLGIKKKLEEKYRQPFIFGCYIVFYFNLVVLDLEALI